MSRRYQTVLTSLFDDRKIRALDEDSKWVFVYLLICKHSNLPGLFILPMSYITRDMQYTPERVTKAFTNLTERRFIEYDMASETIFVRTWLRHKPLDNPNKVKGALAALDEIPDSPLFASLLQFIEEDKPNGYETLTEPLRKRIETLSKEVTVSVSVAVPVEVSVSEVKACESEKTALAPIEPEIPKEPEKPKDPKPPKEPKTPKSPACHAYRDVFHLWPNKTQEEEINQIIIGDEAVAKWSDACHTWAMRGHRPTGVEGMLDWYKNGIPPKPNGKPAGQSDKVEKTMSTVAKRIQKHQREAVASGQQSPS